MKNQPDHKPLKALWYLQAYIERYMWRNERSGYSFFTAKTSRRIHKRSAVLGISKEKDLLTNEEISYDHIVVDASRCSSVFYEKGTPLLIQGTFLPPDEKWKKSWRFEVTDIRLESESERTMIKYLLSSAFGWFDADQTVSLAVKIHKSGDTLESFSKKREARDILVTEIGLKESDALNTISVIQSEKTSEELFRLLAPINVPYSYVLKMQKLYGNEVLKSLKKNPYLICYTVGLTFKQTDIIAEYVLNKFSVYDETSAHRLGIILIYTMKALNSNGNTYSTQWDVIKQIRRLTKGRHCPSIPSLLRILNENRKIGYELSNETMLFYHEDILKAEESVARNLIRFESQSGKETGYRSEYLKEAMDYCGFTFGKQQQDAFIRILGRRGFTILTGGPGTGKTSVTKGILYGYRKIHPDHKVKLCAPTGRAAQRMAESIGEEATTIHRLLNYKPYGESFSYKDKSDPIDADLVIVDEVSMLDIELCAMLLDAVKDNTMILFIGDPNQLESVGPGALLYDLLRMDSDILICSLTEVHRQKGGSPIIDNAIKINQGKADLRQTKDFRIIPTSSDEETMGYVKKVMEKMYDPSDPFKVQILCPANGDGKDAGVLAQNKVLQGLLNHDPKKINYGSNVFKKGDKIIMYRNNYGITGKAILPDDEDLTGYFNGDIGVIEDIDESRNLIVKIRDHLFTITKDLLDDIRLSYGMTIHKSQGSEFPTVIIVMPEHPDNMLVRNLFYTAVTRAKERVLVLNQNGAMEKAIFRNQTGKRKTTLPIVYGKEKKKG